MAVSMVFVFLSLVYTAESVTMEPATDTVVAANSPNNVSYTCQSEEEMRLIFVVNGIQVWSEDQRDDLAAIGVWTETVTASHLTIAMTAEGREEQERLSVSCMTYTNSFGRIGPGDTSDTFLDNKLCPGEVESLQLVYYSQSQLRLQWSRPTDLHPHIPINYTVTMVNALTGDIEETFYTNETDVLVSQRESGGCEVYNFTVVGSNEAGTGPPCTITQNIPLSPSVREIEESQTLEGVTLFGGNRVNVSLSFRPAQVCNPQYPVLKYTLDISGIATLFLNANTSDVVRASVVVYEQSVSVGCRLAAGSSAHCLVVFTRFSDGGTENFTATSPTTQCPELTQTRGAYVEEALVYAVISGKPLIQPFNATVNDAVKGGYKISCKLKNSTKSNISESGSPSSLSGGKLAAAITVPVVIAIIGVVLGVAAVIIYFIRKGEKGTDSTDFG
ncbi:hypothetical protein GBAR_LOCUS25517 [Geodia barretti]|uniref:Fibronectin type-III domain-containing protein n=1 Tax=Geodia barretti TaxID=519541 RepID=A0AA35TET6_GEOBA|nr:hypothetical protein GBAR_LOCUS25517 [Geodia barretti]